MLRVYLAGAIRTGEEYDIFWRKWAIRVLGSMALLLNPLGGKSFDGSKWSIHGYEPTGNVIVPHDFWMVDHCDILLANFTALADNYPCIGTLTEWGRATGRPVLRYAIWPETIPRHPFIDENAAMIFPSVFHALGFLRQHIPVLSGEEPRFLEAPCQTAGKISER